MTMPDTEKPTGERAPARPSTVKFAAASSIGTALEWYDFTIYNLMAALVFNHIFFPSFDPIVGTLLAFSTYAVGYVSRPVGGIIFGHMGDRLGRRTVLVVTIIIMGVTSGLIGVLPGYSSWGIFSPLLLVALRFVQGVALGGEWAGAVLLSMEHGERRHRGRNASFAQVGPSCGSLLGTFVITLTSASMSNELFLEWGWRISFLLSVLLVLVGLLIRAGIDETPDFKAVKKSASRDHAPLKAVFIQHFRSLLIAGGSRIGTDIFYALMVVFSLTYVTTVLGLSREVALLATMLGAVGNAIMVPVYGALSDKVGRRPVYGMGAILAILWAWLFFVFLNSTQPWIICLALVIGLQIHAVMYGPQAAFAAEQFPVKVRYAGTSLSYTLAGILGGGFAPLIITSLYQSSHTTLWVSLYVGVGLLVTLIALWCAKETAGRKL